MQFSAWLGNEVKIERRGWKIFSALETDLVSQVMEVGGVVLLCWGGMKRFDSVKRGNGVGRD